jgi:N-acetylglucosaminyl-diphospho-decaprenol L-rhamnosyltransferase
MPPKVSLIIVSHNTRGDLERCLSELGSGDEVIVVDTGSTDRSQDLVRDRFPHVRLLALPDNPGYGAALNAGIALASGRHIVVLNADAWPLPRAVERLVAFADGEPSAGVIGPRLLDPDGSLQPTVRGFPTLWRLATEYLFLRWLAPRSHALNAFYGSGFDHGSQREADFVVGAVMLLRRQMLDEIGGFDASFFMFNEEVDLCYRAKQGGWRVVFWPGAEFIHVGGTATVAVRPRMYYREQLRSHLRFMAKHHGPREAERTRKLLVGAMQIRALVFGALGKRERRALSLDAAAWLRSEGAAVLVEASTTPRSL